MDETYESKRRQVLCASCAAALGVDVRGADLDAVALVAATIHHDGEAFRAVLLADDDPYRLRFMVVQLASTLAEQLEDGTTDIAGADRWLDGWRRFVEDGWAKEGSHDGDEGPAATTG